MAKVKKDIRQLKSLTKPEFKVQDTSNTGTPSTTPQVVLYNGLTQGVDYNARIGREVIWKSFQSRYTITANATATIPVGVRVIMFWFKQPDGVAPTGTSLLGTALPPLNQMFNLNNRRDFKILHDKIFVITPVTGENSMVYRKHYQRVNLKSIFNAGVTGSITDIESGALYILAYTNTAVGGELPQLTWQMRSRFIDA